jgi:hypothetical protein
MASSYDPVSGLVYTETIHQAAPMRPEWARKTAGSVLHISQYRHNKGASSLKQMVMRTALMNANSLTPEALRSLPWPIGDQLWKQLKIK